MDHRESINMIPSLQPQILFSEPNNNKLLPQLVSACFFS